MINKIRAWDKKENTWFDLTDGIYLSENCDVMKMVFVDCHGKQLRFCDTQPEFSIGKKDKNGEYIFQKDIVKVEEDFFLVDWKGIGFWYIDKDGECFVFDPDIYVIEIKGNVHENPEMFKIN